MDSDQKQQVDFVHDAGLIPEYHGVHVVNVQANDEHQMN